MYHFDWKDAEPRKESQPKKTDEIQPDDQEEVEEEFEIDEPETKQSPRPASKLDLETPLDQNEENDDEEVSITWLFIQHMFRLKVSFTK